jgi:hypothetical protein
MEDNMRYIISEQDRQANLERAGRVMQTLMQECDTQNPNPVMAQRAMQNMHHTIRCLVGSFYATLLKSGGSPNLLMADVDFFFRDIKETLLQLFAGKIKPGQHKQENKPGGSPPSISGGLLQ